MIWAKAWSIWASDIAAGIGVEADLRRRSEPARPFDVERGLEEVPGRRRSAAHRNHDDIVQALRDMTVGPESGEIGRRRRAIHDDGDRLAGAGEPGPRRAVEIRDVRGPDVGSAGRRHAIVGAGLGWRPLIARTAGAHSSGIWGAVMAPVISIPPRRRRPNCAPKAAAICATVPRANTPQGMRVAARDSRKPRLRHQAAIRAAVGRIREILFRQFGRRDLFPAARPGPAIRRNGGSAARFRFRTGPTPRLRSAPTGRRPEVSFPGCRPGSPGGRRKGKGRRKGRRRAPGPGKRDSRSAHAE